MEKFSKLGGKAFIYRVFSRILPSFFFSFILLILAISVFAVTNNNNSVLIIPVMLVILFVFPFFISYFTTQLEFPNLGYKIDTNSVSLRDGILSVNTTIVPFAKITNASLQQSLIQRMFSVGDIFIDQEDSSSKWSGLDLESANKIIKEISAKSNIQPISK